MNDKKLRNELSIYHNMRNAPHTQTHGSHVWTLTHSAVSWVQSLKPWRWSSVYLPRFGSVLSGAHTPLHALSALIQTHTRSHTIYSWARTPGDAHFPCFCLKGGAAMVWNRPGFGRGQTLARPEGGRHLIPPPPGEAMVWDPFRTSTCWENLTLDTLFRPFSTLQIGGGVFHLSQHSRISLFLVPSFDGDLNSWTMPNGDELLTHLLWHMDEQKGTHFSSTFEIVGLSGVLHIYLIFFIIMMRCQTNLIFSCGRFLHKLCFYLYLLYYHTSKTWKEHTCRLTPSL